MVWKLLTGYLPTSQDRRESTITRKRKEYQEYVEQNFASESSVDSQLQHQIRIDVLRTNAHMPLYAQKIIRESLERVLYVWAIRHPASGYVQGINDLVVPFFHTFLQSETRMSYLLVYEGQS